MPFYMLSVHWEPSKPDQLKAESTELISRRFYTLSYSETTAPLEPKFVLFAGTQWAKIAQSLILETIDRVTIESLMVRSELSQFLL